jgi:hypothetical protein
MLGSYDWARSLGLAAAGAALGACGTSAAVAPAGDAGAGTGGDAGADAARADAGLGGSPCGACLASSCGPARTACAAEPDCAAWLACSDTCAPTAGGGPDVACEGSCPAPQSSAGIDALQGWLACRSSAPCAACGVDGGAGPPLLHESCPASGASDACTRCVDERCCEALAACRGSSACVALDTCFNACPVGPSHCIEQCQLAHASGVVAWGQYIACKEIDCTQPCGLSTGPCSDCWFTTCQSSYWACYSDAQCVEYDWCLYACDSTDAACRDACGRQLPEGSTLYGQTFACLYLVCDAACGQDGGLP